MEKKPQVTPQSPNLAPNKQLSYIQQRIQAWTKKKAKENLGATLKTSRQENNPKAIELRPEIDNTLNLTSNEKNEAIAALFSLVSGSGNENYSNLFVSELTTTMANGATQNIDLTVNAFIEAMISMDPNDIIESQLCAKLILLTSKSMHFMNKALSAEYHVAIDKNINRATKLMRLHNETVEALNRYRRKGEQRVTVQHVNVNQGGQAVVAGEFTGGSKKTNKE